jgi:hypothetical protein
MMKKYLMLFALFAAAGAQAKEFFRVTDLPDGWQAHISVEGCKDNHCGGKGAVFLYHPKQETTNVFKSDDLIFERGEGGKISAAKSPLIMKDFTFDGRKDIAVATGNKGPKNSPTYDIYEQGEYGYFGSNYSLTELTKNYMGMFRVDNKQKALIVTNEVDCCTRIEERYRYSPEYILTLFYSRSVDTSDEDKVVVTETRTDRRGNEKTTTRTYTPAQWQRLNK